MVVWDISNPTVRWINEWLVLQYAKDIFKEHEVIFSI